VTERDEALVQEAERLKERDAALDDANHQLDNSGFLLAVSDYDRGDIALARRRLDSIPARHRGWEWYYLRRQVQGGIFTLHDHADWVSSVAFSPDGTRIATGSKDRTAKVWDAQTGATLLELKAHTVAVSSVAFSPDGTRIVTGGSQAGKPGGAKVWDAQSGTLQLELTSQVRAVRTAAFSLDGGGIVTGSAPNVQILGRDVTQVWDARTGQELKCEPIPPTLPPDKSGQDRRFLVRLEGNSVEFLPVQPDAEELSYSRLHTEPKFQRYRERSDAARAARDDFATQFYENAA
jgi:WD40 repeat protein